ncbi:pilus assembly protein, partial [Escherichia coli]|nr:pilus assembly protein [Escherichia coli]EFO0381081.1 pilus assembly protein [Escherichia coli]
GRGDAKKQHFDPKCKPNLCLEILV